MPDCIPLRKIDRLAPLSQEAIAGLTEVMRQEIRVKEDSLLRSEGDEPKNVHILMEGWAIRTHHFSDGSRRITGFLLPGDVCDYQCLLLGKIDHAISTITPARFVAVPREQFIILTREHRDIARALWLTTLLEDSIARAWIANIGRRRALPRVAHLLIELFTRLEMIGLTSDHKCELPLTQAQIADAHGLTTVAVNRALQRLRSQDIISLKARQLEILQPDRLRKLADFDPLYLWTGIDTE